MPPHKKQGHFARPFNPKYSKGKIKMWEDCIILLYWATRNRNVETSISLLSEATGIPRMTLHWILKDVENRKGNSILARAANNEGFDFKIYRTWNTRDKHKRRKKIIDAVKLYEKISN